MTYPDLHVHHGKSDQGVSESEKQLITKKHNDFRLLIAQGKVKNQPKGTNLKKFKWDDKLAAAAQEIANTNQFKHVRVYDARFGVGQNLYQSYVWLSSNQMDTKSDWNAAVTAWFQEHKDYKYPQIPNSLTGHYTQLVWANTEYVGCGYSVYRQDGFLKKLYVCNYGPAGNYVGEAPYETGASGCENLC